MYLEEKLEIIFIMLISYFAAISLMAGNYPLFIVLLSLSVLAKIKQLEISEVLWSAFLGSLMAFLPIILLAINYSSYIPSLGTYTFASILVFSVIISAIVLAATTHFVGLRKDIHIISETLLLVVAACLTGTLAYIFGFEDIFTISGYTLVIMELLSLTVDLYRWAKLKEIFEKILKE